LEKVEDSPNPSKRGGFEERSLEASVSLHIILRQTGYTTDHSTRREFEKIEAFLKTT